MTGGASSACSGARGRLPWRSTGSPSPPPAEFPTCCGPCRRSLGPSGSLGWPTAPDCVSAPLPDPTQLDRQRVLVAVTTLVRVARVGDCPQRTWPTPRQRALRQSLRTHDADPGIGCWAHLLSSGPPRGVVRPRRVVRFARLIQRRDRASWRTFGPRHLRRQPEFALVATVTMPVEAATHGRPAPSPREDCRCWPQCTPGARGAATGRMPPSAAA